MLSINHLLYIGYVKLIYQILVLSGCSKINSKTKRSLLVFDVQTIRFFGPIRIQALPEDVLIKLIINSLNFQFNTSSRRI